MSTRHDSDIDKLFSCFFACFIDSKSAPSVHIEIRKVQQQIKCQNNVHVIAISFFQKILQEPRENYQRKASLISKFSVLIWIGLSGHRKRIILRMSLNRKMKIITSAFHFQGTSRAWVIRSELSLREGKSTKRMSFSFKDVERMCLHDGCCWWLILLLVAVSS